MRRRMGMVIAVKPEAIARYRQLHAAPWTEMDAALKAAGISDYTIWLKQPENLLFGQWTWEGEDYEADMARLSAQQVTRRWLALTDPCQQPLASAPEGTWWALMDEVYHLD